jgi:hypothetical protein
MPTLANMLIPPPKSWDEFQDITLSALKLRWRSANLQQNGRQGQAQAGVDVYGPDDLGRHAGVQCKQTTDELELSTVLAEVKKAEAFKPALEAFFMATTGKRDAKIQTDVRLLSENRLKVSKFPVGVLFWEDIVQDLVTTAGPATCASCETSSSGRWRTRPFRRCFMRGICGSTRGRAERRRASEGCASRGSGHGSRRERDAWLRDARAAASPAVDRERLASRIAIRILPDAICAPLTPQARGPTLVGRLIRRRPLRLVPDETAIHACLPRVRTTSCLPPRE